MLTLDLFRRAHRYISVYAWLIKQHLKFRPILFGTYQFVAVGCRIATIGGLIACAYFLAHLIVAVEHPRSHNIGFGFELNASEYKAIMVTVPAVLLLIAALFQHISTVVFGRLLYSMTTALVGDYVTRMAGTEAQRSLLTGIGYSRLFNKLLRIELRFLSIFQNLLILSTVILGSVLVVGPIIALAIVLLLTTFIGGFLMFRQRHAHDLQRKLTEIDRRRSEVLTELARPAREEMCGGSSHLDKLSQIIHERVFLNLSFREYSRVASLVVQAALITTLLIYVATIGEVEPGQLARLVSFFVIMRFAFGTVQSINTAALTIAPDYPSLVRIMEGRNYLAPSSIYDDLANEDDEDRLV